MEVILTTLASMIKPDERFIMHRYYSTRLSMIVGIILITIWFNYELFVNDHLRLDLAIIAGVMAITKLLAMLYLRIIH
ncbi:MAG: hypothetical protein JSV36_07980 [Anaerolineae bacterium]|nr:MAG: hypothetical protein JSV36_07980 [Anaerolineae bacterium]